MEYETTPLLSADAYHGTEDSHEYWHRRVVSPVRVARELQGLSLYAAFALILGIVLTAGLSTLAVAAILVNLFEPLLDEASDWAQQSTLAAVAVFCLAAVTVVGFAGGCMCLMVVFGACSIPLFLKCSTRYMVNQSISQDQYLLTYVGSIVTLSAGDCRAAAQAIRRSRRLKDFYLSLETLPADAKPIFHALASISSLEVFSWTHMRPEAEAAALHACLSSNAGIRGLYLSEPLHTVKEPRSIACWQPILEAIAMLEHLEFLHIYVRGEWHGDLLVRLASALEGKRHLKHVTIYCAGDAEAATQALVLGCAKLSSLLISDSERAAGDPDPL